MTGMCRHRLSKTKSKKHQVGTWQRRCTVRKHQELIRQFMTREDNSRLQPGKGDCKKIGRGEKTQTHVLTDYFSNLYSKFRAENPDLKISFTSFTRSRPKYILTASFISRHTCLCTKHHNAALTTKALRRAGIDVPSNPEKVVEQKPTTDNLKASLGDTVPVSQWKRIEVEEKGKKKYVTKMVETTMDKDDFVTHFESQMKEFEEHVERVNTQYTQIRHLKENLPQHEVIVQMDFAENYSCKSLEEVQSAYFNQTSVTLHPIVVYYRDADMTLQHRSFIVVSDEMSHKSSTVVAFIEDIMPLLKGMDKDLTTVHYWTDSPTSQYRNKQIFDYVSNHREVHGISARWNYFESGHGKGPCDGLGGTCIRLADQAMRSGKVTIQDANDFFKWAVTSSMTNVTFRYVPTSQCSNVASSAEGRALRPIKGTMKIHAVVGLGGSTVKVRNVSCYCAVCLGGGTCDSWRLEKTNDEQGTPEKEDVIVSRSTQEGVSSQTDVPTVGLENKKYGQPIVDLKMGKFVAAVYDNKRYIGKIVDEDESEVEITFMEQRKQLFQWPRTSDTIWISKRDVLCNIDTPLATGKSRRMYKLSDKDTQGLREHFDY